jgi:phosphoribosylglycinamide formyltransferase
MWTCHKIEKGKFCLNFPQTQLFPSFAVFSKSLPRPIVSKPKRALKIVKKSVPRDASPPETAELLLYSQPRRLAIFVSGGGSNFKAIHAAILRGIINAEVAVVVTNAPSCGGAQYARNNSIPVIRYPASKDEDGLSAEQLVNEVLNVHSVNYIVLAGYLKLIPSELVKKYPRAILNIHPGLLPSFGGKGYFGRKVHEAVISSGARFSGPTVHFIDEEYDTGPILSQAVVPVIPTDTPETLAARVLREEHTLYPHCVAALCDGRITWREDGIPIIWHAS